MISVDKSIKTPLYQQLYSNIRASIISGFLTAGTALPATRRLAQDLDISRNTVLAAYDQLAAEGYIHARVGSGYTVNEISYLSQLNKTQEPLSKPSPEPQQKSYRANFDYGTIDNASFPYQTWKKCFLKTLDQLCSNQRIIYPNRLGEPALRKALAAHLFQARGIRCRPEQVIITSGHQYSLGIITDILQQKTRDVCVENPGYDGILPIFENHGCTLHPITINNDGIAIEEIVPLKNKILYLTPSHQFPIGCVLPINSRNILLHWAATSDSYIIEDDYDSEFRYYTNPIPSLYSLDSENHTIYTGTFSKSLSPNLRVSYIVLPAHLLDDYYQVFYRYNCPVSQQIQLTLATFIQDGYYEAHVSKMCLYYKKKREAFIHAFSQAFGKKASIIGDAAGLHLMADIETDLSQGQMLKIAEQHGIKVYSPDLYYLEPNVCPPHRILFGFASVDSDLFQPLLEELFTLWCSS